MKRITWIILLLIFSLVLAACGGDEPEVTVEESVAQEEPTAQEEPAAQEEPETQETQEEAPVEEPAAKPTDEPKPVEEAETKAEAAISFDDLQMSSLDELTSYRYDVVVDVTSTGADGVETTQTMHMELAVSADPPATSMSMTAEGTDETAEMGTIEVVQIGDTSYMVMAELGCIVLPAGGDSAMSTDEITDSFSPESITEDLENVTSVGEETIDGVDVLHYTYDAAALQGEDAVGIESADGHIYVAKDGGYMVRSIVDVTGDSAFVEGLQNEEFMSATTHIEMNLTDVNEAVEILPPTACEGQEATIPDWPMLDDASEVASFAGIVSYTTEASGEEAIDFYNDAMTELGYTFDESSSFVTEGAGMLTYVNDNDESVSITIAEDPDSGLTSVTILADTDF